MIDINTIIPTIDVGKKDGNGTHMLHVCVRGGYDEFVLAILRLPKLGPAAVQRLLAEPDGDGNTLLHLAVLSADILTVEILIEVIFWSHYISLFIVTDTNAISSEAVTIVPKTIKIKHQKN